MRLCRHLVLLVVCLFGSARLAEPARAADGCRPPDQPVGWIVSVQGRVEVQAEPAAAWRLARPDETLCSRAVVQVGERSRARIALANAPLSLDENTTLHLVGGPEPIRAAAEEPALIRLVRGALYVFSREPRALTVGTPFVDAGIEGTEFVVRVEADRTQVTVFEGVVAARNPYGEARVARGQSVVAEAGKAPTPVVAVRPRDAVAWALYYPPVLTAPADPKAPADLPGAVREALLLAGRGDLAGAFARLDRVPDAERGASFHLHRAALLLSVGRVDEARADIDWALLQDPAAGLAYSLRAVIAVAQNDKAGALSDARRAVELSPRQAAPKIALSYAEQASFELEAARGALLQAVKDEPKNALAWARLSELWLMLGHRNRAREAAETAVALAPELGRTLTVLGFAALTEFRTRAAKAAFERAIALNTADPLPRFGLGLAKIRRGHLEAGRQDIEIAVGLDPASALLRAYLGKAYFEERTANPLTYFKELANNFPNQENTLAAEQFAIAKDLDPNDPTPWLYNAIRLQSENRPVEALRDLEKSIELNDNRAIYRSRELLESDRAARGVSLGRIYNDLGFQQLGINEAAKSLALDPANASAHRFLSDIYQTRPRHQIAQASELLQAQLLQDININPIQPSLSVPDLNIFARGGPARPGFNEFTPLFERNQVQLNLSGEAGSNDTFANEAVVSGLYDRFSLSAGQFHYETDGFRKNNDLQHNIYNLFAQAAITPKFNIQAEVRKFNAKFGDLAFNFNPGYFDDNVDGEVTQEFGRLGIRYSPSPRSHILGSFFYSDREEVTLTSEIESRDTGTSIQSEAQYIWDASVFNTISGLSRFDVDFHFRSSEPGQPPQSSSSTVRQTVGYTYWNVNFPRDIKWTLGLAYEDYEEENLRLQGVSPKLGMQWDILPFLRLRLAAFRTIKPPLVASQMIQPTQVAGFNQFFDDFNGTEAWRYGAGFDFRLNQDVKAGLETSMRELKIPRFGSQGSVDRVRQEEILLHAYLYWTPSPEWSITAGLSLDSFRSRQSGAKVQTWSAPISFTYFHPSGFFARLLGTPLYQEVPDAQASDRRQREDEFLLVDAVAGYRFPQRRGVVSIEVRNLFDSKFNYQDDSFREVRQEPVPPRLIPERSIVGRVTVSF